MTEWYRKHFGKDLKQLVEEGDYKSIREMVLLDMLLFAVAGAVIGISLFRAGWIP